MSHRKYLSLEEARQPGEFKRFCKEQPSEADRQRFLPLLTVMSQGALEEAGTSKRARAASSSGTKTQTHISTHAFWKRGCACP
jgi:hypothetical protein